MCVTNGDNIYLQRSPVTEKCCSQPHRFYEQYRRVECMLGGSQKANSLTPFDG
jgi:hypothetical protein